MKITDYFIKYPVSAFVLNFLFLFIGFLCLNTISLREYPKLEAPVINVRTNYPSASAHLVETSVTNILEDALAGVEGVQSLTSRSKTTTSLISIKFRVGTSMEKALMDTREAIAIVSSSLPDKAFEPVIQKASQNEGLPFMVLSLESDSMDFAELTHYSNLNLKNTFRSLKGVASVQVWGQPYTYKVTLDPQKLFEFGVNVEAIYQAIQKANLSLPAGKFQQEWPVTIESNLDSVQDYEGLLIKTITSESGDVKAVTLGMLSKITLESDNDHFRVRVNQQPGLCLAIERASDANPLEVSDLVRKEVDDLKKTLPYGLRLNTLIDQAEFIRFSIKNIESSIFEATALVLVVIIFFLGRWKASIVPLVTIPISLLGSIIFLKLFGFSLNVMTLLAMVLAIGLVVDDAIVVLENIARYIEEGFSPKEAAFKGAREIGFAIVAMTFTLASVYAPIAFIKGLVGDLFTEFATALAGSVIISGVVAITLSPLMCSLILKREEKEKNRLDKSIKAGLSSLEKRYAKILKQALLSPKLVFSIAISCIFFSGLFYTIMPKELSPKEDRALIGVFIPSMTGYSVESIQNKMNEIEEMVKDLPESKGFLSFVGNWGGSLIIPLKPMSERLRTAQDIISAISPQMTKIPSFNVWPWSSDSGLPGIENSNDLDISVAICTVDPYTKLFSHMQQLRSKLEESGLYASVRHDLRLDSLGYEIDLDPQALSKVHLTPYEVAKTIEVFFSGNRSLEFQKDGISYPITLKSSKAPWTLEEIYMTNPKGQKISLGSVASMQMKALPKDLSHYNQMRSATLTVSIKPEKQQEATLFLEKLINKDVLNGYKASFLGSVQEQKESAFQMAVLFILSLLFIYLILAVQFENFLDPLIVIFTVPLGSVGALGFSWLLGQSINIYSQIGLITLIGLITKHGILIVEFANQLMKSGQNSLEAVMEASKLRLRPILMTTVTTIIGAMPLILSHDAGCEARRVLGAILIGGLVIGTLFTLFAIPLLYTFVKPRLLDDSRKI